MKKILFLSAFILLSGCHIAMKKAFPDYKLDPVAEFKSAWVSRPVTELNLHPTFIVMGFKKIQEGDLEIRDYANNQTISKCDAVSGATQCSSGTQSCHYLFYIRGGLIEKQAWVGELCEMDDAYLPKINATTTRD